MNPNRISPRWRRSRRWLCLGLCSLLVLGAAVPYLGTVVPCLSASIFVQAAEPAPPNTPKEEVVYAKLSAAGKIENIYVVNSFENPANTTIIDYGRYKKIRNMSTTDEITIDGDRITAPGRDGKFFYEGVLSKAELPWRFTIRYYLNDRQIAPDQLAGRDGALRISIKTQKNRSGNSTYFKNFTLQIGLNLDSTKCSNIIARDATIANAGKDKQILFTIMPNQEKDLWVSADVTDFEFPGVSINAINMSLDFDVNGNDLFGSEMTKLRDGVAELDDGAIKLRNGADELNDGFGDFRKGIIEARDGTFKIRDGASETADGARRLNDGMIDLDDGVGELKTGVNKLNNGSYQLYTGLENFASGSGSLAAALVDINNGAGTLATGANDLYEKGAVPLRDNAALLANGFSNFTNGLTQLTAGNESLLGAANQFYSAVYQSAPALAGFGITENSSTHDINQAIAQLKQNPNLTTDVGLQQLLQAMQQLAFYRGVAEYVTGVGNLNAGAAPLADGLTQLAGGSQALADNTKLLADGLVDFQKGTATLAQKSAEFRTGANKLANGSRDLYDGTSELVTGVDKLKSGTTDLVSGSGEFRDGTIELYDGTVTLANGMIDLEKGAFDLKDAIAKLFDGLVKLADGTKRFRSETDRFNEDLPQIIRDKMAELLGNDFKPVSFISKKNTQIGSVQFVLQTAPIKVEKAKADVKPKDKPKSLWQRILDLFRR